MVYRETPNHLFEPPKFKAKETFYNSFLEALAATDNTLTLDIAAIQSYLSFGYICGNRTLLKNVSRQPWLSEIVDNNAILKDVPSHGYYYHDYSVLSKLFFNLLLDEAREVTKNFEQVYVLLSGGLDSRIAAGVLKELYNNNELKNPPKAVTWGLEDSRDVVYAKSLAETLDFEWIHIPITPEIVLNNIQVAGQELGLLHSPEMLHNMLWFRDLPKDSLVIAGSFGDSIGRAEFSNLHLLQLQHPAPKDKFNLLNSAAEAYGQTMVSEDINALFSRSPEGQKYAHYEHFMQGYRMRGGLCQALSVINGNAKIYQMFTSPKVYEYIWSIHPAIRGNEMYIELFKNHLPDLANMPWARTNKALGAKTKGAIKGLRPHYHEYTKWSKNELKQDLEQLVDLDRYSELKVFDVSNIKKLRDIIRQSEARVGRANDIWFWLAGFRVFMDTMQANHKKIDIETFKSTTDNAPTAPPKNSVVNVVKNKVLNKNAMLNTISKDIRTRYRASEVKKLKKQSLKDVPPVKLDVNSFNNI